MRRTLWALPFAAAVAMPAAVPAESMPARVAYRVAVSLTHDGRVLGEPVLYIRDGGSARIAVERAGGYVLHAALNRVEMGGRTLAQLDLTVDREVDGRWEWVATPQLTMPYGGRASFLLDRPGGGEPILRIAANVGLPQPM